MCQIGQVPRIEQNDQMLDALVFVECLDFFGGEGAVVSAAEQVAQAVLHFGGGAKSGLFGGFAGQVGTCIVASSVVELKRVRLHSCNIPTH